MPATVPKDISKALRPGRPPPSGLSAEKNRPRTVDDFYRHGLGYAIEMSNRPQTLQASSIPHRARGLDAGSRHAELQMITRVFDGRPKA